MNSCISETVSVNLGISSYLIHIRKGLLQQKKILQQAINSRQICIVSNSTVADLYLSQFIASLQKSKCVVIDVMVIPEGEVYKNQDTLNSIYDRLIEKKFSRDCLLIALGGGIVGDITGFAAASYQRGVDFIQIPTTLLSQVDSSVGGKTGINHRLGKNLIGAFYQPKTVFIDTNVLKSLPKREISAGMAEIIKYGLIRDKIFLNRLDDIIDDAILLDDNLLVEIIKTSCQHKAEVVAADEKEISGQRAILNLGHTFGHAIEALTEYKTHLHGEAVAIGTMMAIELSHLLGFVSDDDVFFVEQLFRRAGCPVFLQGNIHAQTIRQAMQRDKKVTNSKLRLILLKRLGKADIYDDIKEDLIIQAINNRLIN